MIRPESAVDDGPAFLRVERGSPTAEELAAITVTLAAIASSASSVDAGGAASASSARGSRRDHGPRWGRRSLQSRWSQPRWAGSEELTGW